MSQHRLQLSNTPAATNDNSNDTNRSTSKVSSEEMKELSVALERSVAVPITFSSKNKTMMKYEGRVEYIPVEWHEAFALQSRRTPVAAKQRELASFATTHVKDSPCQMICKPYSKWMKQISPDDSKK